MAGTPEFAEFVATLSADDRELQADLKSAEALTRKSATKMQGNLDKLKVSAGSLGGAMGTLSQAGAAVGGSFGGIVGQGVAATQALAAMRAVISGPVGLIAGIVALTVGVVAYREEASKWLNSMLQSIGILEDLDAALAKAEARQAAKTSVLDKQTASHKRLNVELEQQKRLLNAQRSHDPETVAETQRQIGLEKRIAQELATGGSQTSVKILREIFSVNEKSRKTVEKRLEGEAKQAKFDKEKLERAKRLEQLTKSQADAARSLLIQLGGATPSDFIENAELRQIAMLGELAAKRNRAAAAVVPQAAQSGTFGLRQIQSRFAVVRGGEVIGRQQLTIQEQTKKVAVDHKDITQKIWGILDEINTRDKTGTGAGSALTIR